MANATNNFRAFTLTVSDVSDIVIENKWLLCGGAALGISALVLYNRSFASKACDLTKRNINNKFRGLFNKTFRMTESGPRDTDHSHPRSARNRTDAERSIDNFITMAGFEPYSISTSARDNVGQRLYYSAKDIDLPYQNVKVSSNHVLRMIDVDYYSDVKEWLWLGRPLIIYTFVPETVGGDVIEGVFHIENDVAHVTYNGGGTYVHQLWDYNLDHFIIPGAVWSLMVKVDQVKTPGDPQRRVVLLTPTTWYLSIFDWLFNNPNTLKRRKLTYGAANVSTYSKTVGDNTKCMVSMSPNGSPASVDVEYKTFVGLCMRLQQSKHPNMTDVEKYLRVDGIEEAHVLAPIIFAAYAGGWYGVSYKQLDKMVDCGVAKAPHYQIPGPLITEDGEDIGVEVFKPVVTGAAILPRRSYNNDRQAIEGRINKVKNETKPPGKYLGYMREFVAAFPLSEYDPVSIDEVIVRQNRPAQRARSENGKHWGGHEPFIVRSFMKKESYQSITDPRNISSCPVSHTMFE